MVRYQPNSRQQEIFLSSRADIAIIGGARGGGKTFGLQLESCRHLKRRGFYGALLRATLVAIKKVGGMWDEGSQFYHGLGGSPNKSDYTWTFPSGSKLAYGHLETQSSIENWRGSQVGFLGIDQLETIKEYAFWAIIGSLRGTTGVNSYLRGTCNPDPDSFLYKGGSDQGLLSWWIDTDTGYPIRERSGVLRWFVRDGDTLVWGDSPEELKVNYPFQTPLSVTFVPATVYDNVTLLRADPTYLARLQAMPHVERLRMLGGNWKVRAAAGMTLQASWFVTKSRLPERFLRVIRCWDLAGTKPGPGNYDPDWCAGVLMGLDELHNVWILDIQRFRENTGEVERRIAATARRDGRNVEIFLEQEGGSAGIGWPDAIIRNHLGGFRAQRKRPQGGKLSRAMILAGMAEPGRCFIPDNDRIYAPWTAAFLNEAQSFTDGTQSEHDDQVDAASAAVIELCMGEGLYQSFSQDGGDVTTAMAQAPPGVFRNVTQAAEEYEVDDGYDDGGTFGRNWPGLR